MSVESIELLKKIAEKVLFVPVTTRSIEQYLRVAENKNFPAPEFAVVSNGAFLLRDGKIFEHWSDKKFSVEIQKQFEKFSTHTEFTNCKIVDESFLFLKCAEDVDIEKIQTETSLKVQRTGQKIYLFPPNLNKGEALKNLIKKFSPDKIFCAGDSEIDLPMLNLADVAYYQKNFAEEFLKDIFCT